MIYHSERSSEFAGLRTMVGGGKQVVCETKNGRRVLIDIHDPTAPIETIQEALQEGINARSVLSGVMSALRARNIDVDLAD
jgi:hypothetical protein